MEFVNNSNEFWQGWNDFLGIERDDSHNYTLNLVGDYLDGFKVQARKRELITILSCDEGNSFEIKTAFAYKSEDVGDETWMQVGLYRVENYFIVMNLSNDGEGFLRYVGDNLDLAFDSFRMTIENYQAYIKDILEVANHSDLALAEQKKRKIGSLEYYQDTEIEIPEYSDSYFRTLMIFLSGKYRNNH